jgi:2',3'-cyclic-nucleotide 2'-phosphodiesterase (5'-nucleotidase family)
MAMESSVPRGPTLRIVCVNDVYMLDHLPRLRNLVSHYEKTDPADAFLVTLAGDFVGPSMLSSLDKGRAMIDCLNAVGITHVIFGNHEDDISVEELRQRIAEFRGTWLNTNVPSFLPRLPTEQILEVAAPGGRRVRVALIGVVMQDETVYRRKPFGAAPVLPANTTALLAAEHLMREEGCACVIPLTHQDFADDCRLAQAQTTPWFPVIIGGHEHKVFLEQVAGTWIVKAGLDATSAVVMDLSWPVVAPASGPDLPAVRVKLDGVADYPEDAALCATVAARYDALRELESAVILQLDAGVTLSSIGTRSRQTSVGTLLCSRIRDALFCDGCLLNGGGIRGGRDYSGRITYGDVKNELPFDNEVAAVVLPGRVIREAIASSRAHAPRESGGFLQVDDRMLVQEPNNLLVSIGGAPLLEERKYRIAIMRNLMTGMDHIEPLVRYAAEHPECLPSEGSGREIKIVVVDSFSKELWRHLGSFDSMDVDHNQCINASELASAVARATAAPASRLTVEFLMRALDANHDGVISREEAEAVQTAESVAGRGRTD